MCGIFAHVIQGTLKPNDLSRINTHFEKIKHRGPDYTSNIILTFTTNWFAAGTDLTSNI